VGFYLFDFLTSLAHGGVTSWSVAIGEVGEFVAVCLNCLTGDVGPGRDCVSAVWLPPFRLWF
jgi:hypothetical protein